MRESRHGRRSSLFAHGIKFREVSIEEAVRGAVDSLSVEDSINATRFPPESDEHVPQVKRQGEGNPEQESDEKIRGESHGKSLQAVEQK